MGGPPPTGRHGAPWFHRGLFLPILLLCLLGQSLTARLLSAGPTQLEHRSLRAAPVYASEVVSSFECGEEHADFKDQRVCVFQNLLAWNNSLYYVLSGEGAPRPPEVLVAWEKKFEGDQLLRLLVVTPSEVASLEAVPRDVGAVRRNWAGTGDDGVDERDGDSWGPPARGGDERPGDGRVGAHSAGGDGPGGLAAGDYGQARPPASGADLHRDPPLSALGSLWRIGASAFSAAPGDPGAREKARAERKAEAANAGETESAEARDPEQVMQRRRELAEGGEAGSTATPASPEGGGSTAGAATRLADGRPRRLTETPLVEIPKALLLHQQHPTNYYHLFAEVVPTAHLVACRYLESCDQAPDADLDLIWVNRVDDDVPGSERYAAPQAIRDLTGCLSVRPTANLRAATAAGRALLFRRAAVGLPRDSILYHQKRPEWEARFDARPPAEDVARYRDRLFSCLRLDDEEGIGADAAEAREAVTTSASRAGGEAGDGPGRARAPSSRATSGGGRVEDLPGVRITIVNRPYEAGRRILNADTVADRIRASGAFRALAEDARRVAGAAGAAPRVDVLRLRGSLASQAKAVAKTSVYVWSHGAAMAHVLFLPRGAVAIEVVQWAVLDPSDQHVWVRGIQEAFSLDLRLAVAVNPDRTKAFFNYDVLRAPQSQYHIFNHTEKVELLEDLKCPNTTYASGAECFGWFHWAMSLVLEYPLVLQEKIEPALEQIRQSRGWADAGSTVGPPGALAAGWPQPAADGPGARLAGPRDGRSLLGARFDERAGSDGRGGPGGSARPLRDPLDWLSWTGPSATLEGCQSCL